MYMSYVKRTDYLHLIQVLLQQNAKINLRI